MKKSNNAEEYIAGHRQWRELLVTLRDILQSTGLEEAIKWGVPVYTLDGKNIVGIAAFKKHVALLFHQGALLEDKAGKLINAQQGKSQAQRQWRFEEGDQVDRELVLAYVVYLQRQEGRHQSTKAGENHADDPGRQRPERRLQVLVLCRSAPWARTGNHPLGEFLVPERLIRCAL